MNRLLIFLFVLSACSNKKQTAKNLLKPSIDTFLVPSYVQPGDTIEMYRQEITSPIYYFILKNNK